MYTLIRLLIATKPQQIKQKCDSRQLGNWSNSRNIIYESFEHLSPTDLPNKLNFHFGYTITYSCLAIHT